MALTATPATLSFASPLAASQNVVVQGGVAPYTGLSLNPAIATVSAPTPSPNLYTNSDTLSSATLTNLTLGTGGPGGAVDAEYTGTGSTGSTVSIAENVPAAIGANTLSAWVDASQVISGSTHIGLYDVTGFGGFGAGTFALGGAASRVAYTNTLLLNLVSDAYASGWTPTNGAVASNTLGRSTTPTIQLTGGTQTATSPLMSVTPGSKISVSSFYDATRGNIASGSVLVQYYDQTNTIIPGIGLSYSGASYSRQAQANFTVPSGVTGIKIVVNANGATFSGTMQVGAHSLVNGTTDPGGWLSPTNPLVSASIQISSPVVTSGQQFKISQPMLRTDGVTSPYVGDDYATFTVTPVSAGTTTIELSDSTPVTPLEVSIPTTISIPNVTFLAPNNAGDAGDPLPAGIFTSIATSGGTVAASGYLGIGGGIPAILTPGIHYTATFVGTHAPNVSVTFTAVAQSQNVVVSPYASPAHSQLGYAADEAVLYPRGWSADTALAPGGGIYPIFAGAAAELVDLNEQNQGAILASRLQSSINGDIDAWIADYCGGNFQRFAGESNAAYIARFQAFASAQLSTREGVATVAGFYGTVVIDEPWRTFETGAFDTNGTLAFDTIGGLGSQQPQADVYIQPATPFTQSQAAQAKAQVLAARGLGISTSVFQVTQSGSTLTATKL
jgi:hypothetical protein